MEVLDEQIEPLPVEPWERCVHRGGITQYPLVVPAHAAKPFEQWCAGRVQLPTVDADCCVGAVEADTESLGKKARHGRLASAATAAHPPHMIEVGHLMIVYRRAFGRQTRACYGYDHAAISPGFMRDPFG